MKTRFFRMTAIFAVCAVLFGFTSCETGSDDATDTAQQTTETKGTGNSPSTPKDDPKTDDSSSAQNDDPKTDGQDGDTSAQTGKHSIIYALYYENETYEYESEQYDYKIYKLIYFDDPYTLTENDLSIPEPKSYMTGDDWVFDGWKLDDYSFTHLTAGVTIDENGSRYFEGDHRRVFKGYWRKAKTFPLYYLSVFGSEQCPQNVTVKENEVLTAEKLPELSCEGHTFNYWYIYTYDSDGSGKETPIAPGFKIPINWDEKLHIQSTGSTAWLNAKWDSEPVAVTFVTEHGTAPEPLSVTKGTTGAELAEILSDDAYMLTDDEGVWEFVGWQLDSTIIASANGRRLSIFGDAELTALWQKKQCTLTFVTEHGTTPEPLVLAGGTPRSDVKQIVRENYNLMTPEGYNFLGWNWENTKWLYYDGEDRLYDDIQITAEWDGEPVEVTFVTDRGTAPESLSVAKGATGAGLAKILSDDAYMLTDDEGVWEFVGWQLNNTIIASDNGSWVKISGDTELKAVWQKKQCTLTFVTERGTTPKQLVLAGGTPRSEVEQIVAEKYNLTCEGYDFLGWNWENTKWLYYDGEAWFCDDIQITAEWKIKTFTVNFETNDPAKKTWFSNIKYNEHTEPPSLSNSGYKLDGWYRDSACTTKWNFETDVVTSDMTLYAKWFFIVKFDANGGNGTMENQVFTYGIEDTLRENTFTPSESQEHYQFIGWGKYSFLTSPDYIDCENITSISSSYNGEATLYAIWANDSAVQIREMTESGTIKPDFALTDKMMTEIKAALLTLYDKNPNIQVSLDLSTQTQLAELSSYAFSNCKNLISVTLPNILETIKTRSFYNCESLTTISVPDTVTKIENLAFEGCTSLESITLPFVGNTVDETTSDCAFSAILGDLPPSLKNVTVNSGVISFAAFADCSTIEKIVLGENITKIKNLAFDNCKNLKEITIPASVTEIQALVFFNCENLSADNIIIADTQSQWRCEYVSSQNQEVEQNIGTLTGAKVLSWSNESRGNLYKITSD